MPLDRPDPGVRVVKPFGQFSAGRVIFPDGVMRQRWLSSGFVEVVKAAPAEPAREAGEVEGRKLHQRR